MYMKKSKAFIASSSEGINVAYALQALLEHDVECTIWDQDVFSPSSYTLLDILDILNKVDYGIFVFTFDDFLTMRDTGNYVVRDNVILELGIFLGYLGRERCFIIRSEDTENMHLPTDLLGMETIFYNYNREDGNIKRALGSVKYSIINSIMKQKIRVKMNDFMYVIGDNPDALFSKIIKDAKRVSILGRTAINIANLYDTDIKESLETGCVYRILICDHEDDLITKIYSKRFMENAVTARLFYGDIQKKYPNLELRTTKRILGYSMTIVEYNDIERNFINFIIYQNTMKGNQRPMFTIKYDNNWYNKFVKEFDFLWCDKKL